MPTLSITKSYADDEVLFEADLDAIKDDIESFLNITKIDDDNIQDAGITASTKVVDGSITTAKLAASSVTTAKINDSAVTTAKINDSAVTTAKINDSAVTTAKINDSAVTTAKINDGVVTYAKRTLNYQESLGCGNFSVPSAGSFISVTNLSISLTSLVDRVVTAYLYPETASSRTSQFVTLALFIDGVQSDTFYVYATDSSSGQTHHIPIIKNLTAGSHTIDVRAIASSLPQSVNEFKLLVLEH